MNLTRSSQHSFGPSWLFCTRAAKNSCSGSSVLRPPASAEHQEPAHPLPPCQGPEQEAGMQGRHSQQEPVLSWEHSEHMAHSHSKLGKEKAKSDVGQLDCARNTGINGEVPGNQLCVSLPGAIERQGGLIVV